MVRLKRLAPILLIMALMTALTPQAVSAGGGSNALVNQVRYYLKHVLGVAVPDNAVFHVRLAAPPTNNASLTLWGNVSLYNITMCLGGVKVPLQVLVGPGSRVIGLGFINYDSILKVNWARKYVIKGISYNSRECILRIANSSKLLATLLSIIKNVSTVKGVRKYLHVFTSKLCIHGCLRDVRGCELTPRMCLCPGDEEGVSMPLPNGYYLEVGLRVIKGGVIMIRSWLKVNLTEDLLYRLLYVGLTEVRGDEYVVTYASWRPYRIAVFKPSAKLKEELANTSLNYVRERIKHLIPRNIKASTCRLKLKGVMPFTPHELMLSNLSILVENSLAYLITLNCKYNSTARWIHNVLVIVDPYTKHVVSVIPEGSKVEAVRAAYWLPALMTVVPAVIAVTTYITIRGSKRSKGKPTQ